MRCRYVTFMTVQGMPRMIKRYFVHVVCPSLIMRYVLRAHVKVQYMSIVKVFEVYATVNDISQLELETNIYH